MKPNAERALLIVGALVVGYAGAFLTLRSREPKSVGALSDKIPTGYRAVSMPLSCNETAMVRAGDRADVTATFDHSDSSVVKEARAETILQNVLIMALQRPRSESDCGAVVLALNPNEVQYAFLVMDRKKAHISLRARGDFDMHPMGTAIPRKLFR